MTRGKTSQVPASAPAPSDQGAAAASAPTPGDQVATAASAPTPGDQAPESAAVQTPALNPAITRSELEAALSALPGDYADAEYVVNGMRGYFRELFTAEDEARVRDLVKPVAPTRPGPAAPTEPELVPARVLMSGVHGRIDTIAYLPPHLLAQAVAAGQVDPHPDAVAYAASLKR